jgi:cellulose biosynthesis protein BcsQ
LDVIVGGEYLAGVSAALSNDPDRRLNSLARTLAVLAPRYDIVLIDCPPGDKTLQVAGAAASRWLITPVRGDAASAKGLDLLTGRMDEVMAVNPAVELLGVVLFGIERNAKRVDSDSRADIAVRLDSDAEVFNTTIRHSSAVAQQTRARGLLVHELDEVSRSQAKWFEIIRGEAPAAPAVTRTASSVADDLHNLALEIIDRISIRESVNQPEMEIAA